ncbi:MAG TPA: CPBP family intramembrane glutamic endopeptidase [Anaerolineales bacterium]|nr:CPBP family intramembrane glutamic endopeptidase [Anaerolineales bacterium]
MSIAQWVSVGVMVIVSTVAFITAYRKRPVIGILAAAFVVLIFIWYRKQGLNVIGFVQPKSWLATGLWGVGLGMALYLLSTLVIDPFIESSTGKPTNLDFLDKIRGNWKQLLLGLLLAWVLTAFLAESIFRGFLMSEIGNILTRTGVFAAIGLLISAIVYGAAHWHRGESGILGAAILGLLLGDIFIWSGYNLWMPILAHAVLETISLILVFFNQDKFLKNMIWKEKKNERSQRPAAKNR